MIVTQSRLHIRFWFKNSSLFFFVMFVVMPLNAQESFLVPSFDESISWYDRFNVAVNRAYYAACEAEQLNRKFDNVQDQMVLIDTSLGNSSYAIWCAEKLHGTTEVLPHIEALILCQKRIILLSEMLVRLLSKQIDAQRSLYGASLSIRMQDIVNDLMQQSKQRFLATKSDQDLN